MRGGRFVLGVLRNVIRQSKRGGDAYIAYVAYIQVHL